jgi:predicted 2-oxoglutarate/Fe(II)-dependent dioxygenase YbiX
MPDRNFKTGVVSNPALGVNIYSGLLTLDDCTQIVETLEKNLSGSKNLEMSWNDARVTSSTEADLSARNAKDFKISSTSLGPKTEKNSELYSIHNKVFSAVYPCVDDYGSYWGAGMRSFEAFNFVKYEGPGTHFKIHADHGPTYVSTISIVVYLNEDYEGGELWFPRLDNLTIKPKTGDIVVFPSTYIYEHASQGMVQGTKYSVVIMSDYNDRDNVNQRVAPTIQNYELKH